MKSRKKRRIWTKIHTCHNPTNLKYLNKFYGKFYVRLHCNFSVISPNHMYADILKFREIANLELNIKQSLPFIKLYLFVVLKL